jgi:peptidoglycan/LPS O-acetylase OafA/YrhL
VRGLAILLVLFAHAAVNVPPGPWPALPGRLFFTLCSFGWVGVDLFFVLSGFLITGILLDARGAPHYFRNFYARRTLRIFPLYYGVLVALLVVAPLFPSPVPASGTAGDNPLWLWLYASNVGVALKGGSLHFSDWFVTGHFWSLAVEEQFYLAWPVVVLLFGPKGLRRVCVGCMAGALALRAVLATCGADAHATCYLTPCKMDALAAGAWLAATVREVGVGPLVRPARLVAVAAGAVLLCLAADAFAAGRGEPYDSLFMRTVGLSVLWAFFAAVLVLALAAPPDSVAGRFWRSPPLGWLGKYSYGIYVFHGLFSPLLGLVVLTHLDGWDALGQSVAYEALTAGLALPLAWLSWHVYERHWLRLKRFFPAHGGTTGGA